MKKTITAIMAILLVTIAAATAFSEERISTRPRIELNADEARNLILGTWIETQRLAEDGRFLRTSLFNEDEIIWTYNEDGTGIQTFTVDDEFRTFQFSWKVFEDDGKLWVETLRVGDLNSFVDELVFFHNNQHIAIDGFGVFDDFLLDGTEIGVLGWVYNRVRD